MQPAIEPGIPRRLRAAGGKAGEGKPHGAEGVRLRGRAIAARGVPRGARRRERNGQSRHRACCIASAQQFADLRLKLLQIQRVVAENAKLAVRHAGGHGAAAASLAQGMGDTVLEHPLMLRLQPVPAANLH